MLNSGMAEESEGVREGVKGEGVKATGSAGGLHTGPLDVAGPPAKPGAFIFQ
jgi:hypothetical protein